MTRLRVVLLDVDGTLLDRAGTLRAYLEGHLERLGVPVNARKTYRRRYLELDAGGTGDRHALAARLVREFKLDVRPATLVLDFQRHAWAAPRLAPGALDTLHDLHTRGLRVGAVTNGLRAAQHAKLRRAGLWGHLDAVVVGTPRGPRKPHPEVFLQAARALGVDAPACLMVGDHPDHDVAGARGAGMRAAWCSLGRAWPARFPFRPDVILDDLRDLRAWLGDGER